MNQELTIYKFKENPVRIVMDEKGEPWFVAKDICDVLGFTNPTMALKKLPKDNLNLIEVHDASGRLRLSNIINEPGMYMLVLRSDKPQAKEFQYWVTHEVLPSIRKTGSYSNKPMTQLDIIQQAIDILKNHDQRVTICETEITTLKTESNPSKKRKYRHINSWPRSKILLNVN